MTPGVGLSNAAERHAIGRFLGRNPGLSFVAEAGGRLVATILCGHGGRRGLIHHLVVAPSARGHGLARALLRSALRGLQLQDIDKCHLLAFCNNGEGRHSWHAVSATERIELALFSMSTEGAD
jgi:N-acetylglutamate synthase